MEQHAAVAHFAADGKLTLWSSTQTPHYVHRLLTKILDLPGAHIRVIAAPVGGGFGGKLDPFAHEIAACKLSQLTGRPGEDRLHPRGGLLHPPRAPSGADVAQDGLHEGRRHHGLPPPDLARRRRLRLLRRGLDLLHGRDQPGHLQDAGLQVRGRARVHQQAAVRSQARPRHAAAALRARMPARQGGRAARPRSRRPAAAHPPRAVHQDGQPPDGHHDRPRRVHRQGGGGLGLARQARALRRPRGRRRPSRSGSRAGARASASRARPT